MRKRKKRRNLKIHILLQETNHFSFSESDIIFIIDFYFFYLLLLSRTSEAINFGIETNYFSLADFLIPRYRPF